MDLSPKDLLSLLSKTRPSEGCWDWVGAHSNGYSRWRGFGAHSILYQVLVGPIPAGYELDHFACQNKGCVNPRHVEPVPIAGRENTRRWQALKTHCPRGHEYTVENTYNQKNERGTITRACKICRNLHARNSHRRAKAAARQERTLDE